MRTHQMRIVTNGTSFFVQYKWLCFWLYELDYSECRREFRSQNEAFDFIKDTFSLMDRRKKKPLAIVGEFLYPNDFREMVLATGIHDLKKEK